MKVQLPRYLDGFAKVFKLESTNENFPVYEPNDLNIQLSFELLSISDVRRMEFEARGKRITMKIRIPQWREISVDHLLEIEGVKHKVFNAYHFKDKDGFPKTDITLEVYHA